MNLRESMLAAGEDAPLATPGVSVDQIIRQGRRATAARRTSLGGVGVAVVCIAVAITSMGAPQHGKPAAAPVPHVSAPSTPTSVSKSPTLAGTSAPVMHLTAADLVGTKSSTSHKPQWLLISFIHDRKALDALAANPCVLPEGATAGKNFAPTPEDMCNKITVDGTSAWVRRWGYSPQLRPWTTKDTDEVDIFFQLRGRTAVLSVSNTIPPKGKSKAQVVGQSFDLSNSEIKKLVPNLAHDFRN